MPLAPEWQQPYINVFKLCDVDTMREFEKRGDVTEHMDRIIGKKVFKVRGIIPASNFLRVPRGRLQSLGLTGRFLYVQVKVSPVKVFAVHIEAVTADQNVHRVSVSNMYSQDALKRKSNGVQIPFPKPSHRWCVMALDMREALAPFSSSPYHSVKSIQMCSWLTVRTMFTSDYKFCLENLPADMALSLALDSGIFEMVWLPKEPIGAPTMDNMPPPKRSVAKRAPHGAKTSVVGSSHGDDDDDDDTESQDTAPYSGTTPAPTPTYRPALAPAVAAAAAGRAHPGNLASRTAVANVVDVAATAAASSQNPTAAKPAVGAPAPVHSFPPPARGSQLQALHQSTLGVDQPTGPALEPDPALELIRLTAYSGEFVRTLVWAPDADEVVFAAASVVVAMKASSASGQQRYFLGHNAFVCALALSTDGLTLASAQEGKEALVRLWDFPRGNCLAIVSGHASGMSCLDLSPDCRALAAVGLDAHGRQTIALWNIAHLRSEGKVELVTRHATEFNIKVLRFSAYQEDHLMTGGKDSIRMYRLKHGQLRGTSVRLTPPDKRVVGFAGSLAAVMGPNIFTDIAFEAGVGVYGVDAFRVNYNTRVVDVIYQLHGAAINCLIVADGLVVTGSDDRLLRVWPLDFRDYLMEAEHESAVTALAISPDGLRLAIGTESGTLGALHVPTHGYTTLLRSHCGAVHCVAADPNRDQFCTVSADGTIRIWDLATHQQLYEFDAPGESVTCVAYHPRHHELAVGFANGRLRIFDIPSTTLVQEHQQHRAAVAEVLFSPDGGRLFSGGLDGALVVYDVQRVYTPVQFLSAGVRDIKVCLAMSSDGAFFASLSRDPYRSITSLLVFHGRDLEPFMRIETDAPSYVKLAFSADSSELWALSSTRRLDRYELKNGQLVQQVQEVSNLDLTTLAVDPRGRYLMTTGNDAVLRLWGVTPWQQLRAHGLPSSQTFAGHPSAVLAGAFHPKGYIITVGDADCIAVWRISADATAAAAAQAVGSPSRRRAAPSPRALSLRERASPSTALGPVASPAHHSLTDRVAALGAQGAPDLGATLAGMRLKGSPSAGGASVSSTAPSDATLSSQAASSISLQPSHSPSGSPTRGSHRQRSAAAVAAATFARSTGLLATGTAHAAPPPPLACSSLVGYSPTGAPNVAWNPGSGLFAYVVDDTVVLEDLATRKQRYFRGHIGPLTCLAASADSTLLAAAPLTPQPSSSFADVVVWDVASGEERWRLKYHPLGVQVLSFSPDGYWLVSIGREPERSVVVWDMASGQLVAAGRAEGVTRAAAWLRGGPAPLFATAGADGLMVYTLQDSYLEQRSLPLGDQGEPSACCALAADESSGALVVVEEATGVVWHVAAVIAESEAVAMVQVASLAGYDVSCLAVGPSHALVGTRQGHVIRYDRATDSGTWQELSSIKLDGAVVWLAAEERRMADAVVASSTSTIWFVGMEDGSTVPIVCGQQSAVLSLCPCPDQPNLIASTAIDGMLRVWQLRPQDVEPAVELQSSSACTCAAFLPGGGGHCLGGYADGSLRLIGLRPSVCVAWAMARHAGPVVAVAAHPTKPMGLTAASDGTLAVTDLTSTRLLAYITNYTAPGAAAAPGHAGSTGAAGASSSGPGQGPLQALAVSPGSGSVCAAAWRGRLVVFPTPWEDPTCRPMAMYEVEAAQSSGDTRDVSPDVPALVAFVPTATKLLAYTSPLLLGRVVLYDYRLAAVVRSVAVPQMVRSLALSPDGTCLVLGGVQRSVFLVQYDTGKSLELPGHCGAVVAAAFTADSSQFVTAAGSSLMLWDRAQLYRHVEPPPPPRMVSELA